MIIAVEGVSAAGKTTWSAKHGRHFLLTELRFPDPEETLGLEGPLAGRFWAQVNAARWQLALTIEAREGQVVCDEDPLKLHYSYCLWRLGKLGRDQFRAHAAEVRGKIAERALGFADVVLFKDVDRATAQAQKSGDSRRARHRFDLHVQMIEPLRDWYAALRSLRPERVIFAHPDDGLDSIASLGAGERYDLARFDELIGLLDAK